MKRVERSREVLKYTIDSQPAPILEVELGESFTLGTEDACSGIYRTLEDAAGLLDAWYLKYSSSEVKSVDRAGLYQGNRDKLTYWSELIPTSASTCTRWR